MIRLLSFIFLTFNTVLVSAQISISGTVKTANGQPVSGVNITLVNTYDGATTNVDGKFNFKTTETGQHWLTYSAFGYLTDSVQLQLNSNNLLTLQIRKAINDLNLVTITAGTLEASDVKKGAVLSSLDVVTTAGSVADIVAAQQTLPGTGQAFGQNGLFVRGGSGGETHSYFDGMLLANPFGSQLPDLSSRFNLSPFLFKGTTFSSGGYSAEYGQALSSVLLLETKDLPEKSSTEFSLLSLGVGAAHTEKMQNSSLTIGGNYYNFQPSFQIIKQKIDWGNAPSEEVINLQYKWKPTKHGMLKVFTQYSNSDVSLYLHKLDGSTPTYVINHNQSSYLNATYRDELNADWKIKAGLTYNYSHEHGNIDSNADRLNDNLLQGRLTLTRMFSRRSLIRSGAEFYSSVHLESWNSQNRSLTDNVLAGFSEGEFYFNDMIAIRLGIRTEHSSYVNHWNIAPRTSLAIKTGERSQVSFAYGLFYQNPNESYMVQSSTLGYENAIHYILNYQYQTDLRIFRIEAYDKEYGQLTKYTSSVNSNIFGPGNYANLNNSGFGHARGIDIFWRDKKTVRGGDYWISYSFLDTRRNAGDYPVEATPPFAATHTLNVVYKQFIPLIKSELGATYSFSSGRTYYNPNNPIFLADRTKTFNNLSFNISYLTKFFSQFTVIYATVNNLPGFDNIYGYNYSANGQNRTAITPSSKRNFLIGMFVTIGDNTFNH